MAQTKTAIKATPKQKFNVVKACEKVSEENKSALLMGVYWLNQSQFVGEVGKIKKAALSTTEKSEVIAFYNEKRLAGKRDLWRGFENKKYTAQQVEVFGWAMDNLT